MTRERTAASIAVELSWVTAGSGSGGGTGNIGSGGRTGTTAGIVDLHGRTGDLDGTGSGPIEHP